jgi:metal-responsive CopG/Arc/MetJ family transcriptional regulator
LEKENMETIIIETNSKETTRLLQQLSRQLHLRHKKLSKGEMEDFLLARSIDEGRKSGYVSKSKLLKTLKK